MLMSSWRKRDRVQPLHESDELSQRMRAAAERLNSYAATMRMLIEQDPNGGTESDTGPTPRRG